MVEMIFDKFSWIRHSVSSPHKQWRWVIWCRYKEIDDWYDSKRTREWCLSVWTTVFRNTHTELKEWSSKKGGPGFLAHLLCTAQRNSLLPFCEKNLFECMFERNVQSFRNAGVIQSFPVLTGSFFKWSETSSGWLWCLGGTGNEGRE